MPTAKPMLFPNSSRFRLLTGLVIIFSLSGCDHRPDSVTATPRNSPHQPVFTDESGPRSSRRVTDRQRQLAAEFDFVTPEQAICVRLAVPQILQSPSLKDIPWEALQNQLQRIMGPNNGKLESLESIWFMLEGKGLASVGTIESNQAGLYIVRFNRDVDQNEWESTASIRRDILEDAKMSSLALDAATIAFGKPETLMRLKSGDDKNPPLIFEQIEQWDLANEVCGAIRFEAIRPSLQAVANLMSRMIPNAQKFSELPEALNSAVFSVGLDQQEAAALELQIREAESFLEATRSLAGMMTGSSGNAFGGPWAQLAAQRSSAATTMIESVSEQPLEDVTREIQNKNLFSVVAKDDKIRFTLQRPEKLNVAIRALILDLQKQIDFATRVQRYNRIADALADYVEAYGQLPPLGLVTEEQANEWGVPQQFNWRVGILTQLGLRQVYDQLDFSRPWDDPANTQIQAPDVFNDGGQAMSRLRMNVGKTGIYRGDMVPLKIPGIGDPTERTALAVESAEAEPWLRPLTPENSSLSLDSLGASDENGVLFVSCDFNVKIVKRNNRAVQAVISADGGEKQSHEDFIAVPIA